MPVNFAMIGAAGYIAPRHLQAIKDTGNRLVAALDRSDSVGILDRFFYDVDFFQEFERFDRHAEMLRRKGDDHRLHYVSICSPNYLHDAHIRFALRIGAHAICEKPLVLNPWNLDPLAELEQESGRKVFNILQLRLHPAIAALRERVQASPPKNKTEITLTYVTARGRWYFYSWKGDEAKSGGIATNIGIHFFDMLIWIFGPVESQTVHLYEPDRASGVIELETARVRWFLSVNRQDLPPGNRDQNRTTFRSLAIGEEQVEFSDGFTDLHTRVYQDILAGKGFGIADARPSVVLAHQIRQAPIAEARPSEAHPLLTGLARSLKEK